MPHAAAHVPEQHLNHVSPKMRAVVVPLLLTIIISSAALTLHQLPLTMVAHPRTIMVDVPRCKCQHLHETLPDLHLLQMLLPTITTCPRHPTLTPPSSPEQDATASTSKNPSTLRNVSHLSGNTRASPQETTPVPSTRQTYHPSRVQCNTTPHPTSLHPALVISWPISKCPSRKTQ